MLRGKAYLHRFMCTIYAVVVQLKLIEFTLLASSFFLTPSLCAFVIRVGKQMNAARFQERKKQKKESEVELRPNDARRTYSVGCWLIHRHEKLLPVQE